MCTTTCFVFDHALDQLVLSSCELGRHGGLRGWWKGKALGNFPAVSQRSLERG